MSHDGSTTGNGAPAASDRNSLTLGADGPIVLHDHHGPTEVEDPV